MEGGREGADPAEEDEEYTFESLWNMSKFPSFGRFFDFWKMVGGRKEGRGKKGRNDCWVGEIN